MAIIDTLKLARALREKGGFSAEAAEATAEALNSALGADVATKADIAAAKAELKADVAAIKADLDAVKAELKSDVAAVKAELKSDVRLLQWQIAIVWALQIAILVKLFVH